MGGVSFVGRREGGGKGKKNRKKLKRAKTHLSLAHAKGKYVKWSVP